MSSASTSSASRRLSRLSSGSPMPMNTRLRLGERRGSAKRIACTWATISLAVRLRPAPQKPVTQKRHASAQPAWLETHNVWRPRSGMSTASIVAPSFKPKRNLRVPSSDWWSSTTRGRSSRQCSAILLLRSLLSVVISSSEFAPCRCTASKTCPARKGRSIQGARAAASLARGNPRRSMGSTASMFGDLSDRVASDRFRSNAERTGPTR